MKKFFMIRFVMYVIVVFVLVMFVTLSGVNIASAETERYDFLKSERKAPFKLTFPAPPPPTQEKQDAHKRDVRKRNEAKQKSIAALLRQYNKKLSGAKAHDYADFIMQASAKFGQDPFVIAAMVVNESSARHDVVSRGGDYGLMQVRWRVHQKKIKKKYPHIENAKDMLNPQNNLLVGTEIFSTYHATAKQDVRNALLYYSAGNKRLVEKVFTILAKLEKSYLEHLKNS